MLERETILIRHGRVIDPSQKLDGVRDLLIQNGKIAAIERPGRIAASRAKTTIEAKNHWVLPGLIDMHTHLREPGQEYKETIESGTRAAAAGGFTSVVCMANTSPVNDTPYVTAFIRDRAKIAGASRVFPVGALSKGLSGDELAEIGGMVSEGACAISDDGMPVMNAYLMRKGMDYAKAFAVPVISHAEDANLVGHGAVNESALSSALGLRGSPAAAEEILVARDIALCRLTRCHLHFAHISTALAIEHIRRAKEEGLPVTSEVTPHHLTLTEEEVRGYDTNFKMAPPLRTRRDVQVLQRALADGVIDAIASDHAPHGQGEKAVEFDLAANGTIGLQSTVPVSLELVRKGKLSVARWVDSMTGAPARILGLDLGTLKKGSLADVTIIDPKVSWVFSADQIHSKSHNSAFLGEKLRGRALVTIVGGKIVHQAGA